MKELKNAKNFKTYPPLFFVIILIVCAGLGLFYYKKQRDIGRIGNFEECVRAGYLVLETYPEQCRTPDNRNFAKELSEEEKQILEQPGICQDKCGDGICQQIVCMSENCPCAESALICSKDCKDGQGDKTGLANPASANCLKEGGSLEIRKDASGNETGYCIFDNKSECEEWAFFRNTCKKGQIKL